MNRSDICPVCKRQLRWSPPDDLGLGPGQYYLTHYSNVVMIADPEHGALQYSNPDNFTNE